MEGRMKYVLKRIACFFGFHEGFGVRFIQNYMTVRGPRRLYQCKGCNTLYSEKW
jgi:hypothetical protein